MLVLTRKYQEKIRIGDNITITVLRTKGKAVRLGIEAPTDVPVVRGELTFETTEEAADETTAAPATESIVPMRAATRRSEMPSTWDVESPRGSSEHARQPRHPQVQLSRISRSDVADYLPKVLDGNAGPLRAMMQQR